MITILQLPLSDTYDIIRDYQRISTALCNYIITKTFRIFPTIYFHRFHLHRSILDLFFNGAERRHRNKRRLPWNTYQTAIYSYSRSPNLYITARKMEKISHDKNDQQIIVMHLTDDHLRLGYSNR